MTYSIALPTGGGWVGLISADPWGAATLYENATVCPSEVEAEAAAWSEWLALLNDARSLEVA